MELVESLKTIGPSNVISDDIANGCEFGSVDRYLGVVYSLQKCLAVRSTCGLLPVIHPIWHAQVEAGQHGKVYGTSVPGRPNMKGA